MEEITGAASKPSFLSKISSVGLFDAFWPYPFPGNSCCKATASDGISSKHSLAYQSFTNNLPLRHGMTCIHLSTRIEFVK